MSRNKNNNNNNNNDNNNNNNILASFPILLKKFVKKFERDQH